jgi:hypothetical protein
MQWQYTELRHANTNNPRDFRRVEWAAQKAMVPHIDRTISSTVEEINAGLQSLKEGGRTLGKGVGNRRSRPPEGT